MTREERIKEMAELTFDYVDSKDVSKLYLMGSNAYEEIRPLLHNYGLAEFLYNAGYRKSDEYEADIEYLNRRIAELEQDLVHAEENVFYREQNIVLYEEKIKSEARKEAVKEFAEKLKERLRVFDDRWITYREIDELLKEYRVGVEE